MQTAKEKEHFKQNPPFSEATNRYQMKVVTKTLILGPVSNTSQNSGY